MLSRALKVHVNGGQGAFGGNGWDRSFLIHTGEARRVLRDGFLEEVLIHEGAHVSLDLAHASSPGWLAAQRADDGVFISEYARDYPDREDVAESILPWFAARVPAEPAVRRGSGRDRVRDSEPARLLRRTEFRHDALQAARGGAGAGRAG